MSSVTQPWRSRRCLPAALVALLSLAAHTCAPPISGADPAPSGTAALPIAPFPMVPMMPPFVPPPVLAYAGVPVPTDGVILIRNDNGALPTVQVTSLPDGILINGTVSQVSGVYFAFKPDAPFAVGNYGVTLTNPAQQGFVQPAFGPQSVVVVDEPVTLPEVRGSLTLSLAAYGSMTECCHTSPLLGFMQIASCFDTENVQHAQLTPGLSLVDGTSASVSQHLFQLRAAGDASSPIWQAFANAQTSLQYSTQAEEYCFELLALDARTLATHSYDELTPRCAGHGNLDALGTVPLEVQATQLDRLTCPMPPEAFREDWCDVNGAACAGARQVHGCETYGHVCEGEPPPAPPGTFAGAGGASGGLVAGASGTSGSGAFGQAGMGEMATAGMGEESSGSSGCSAVLAQRGSSGWLWAMLTVLLISRRRRSHRNS